MARPIKENADWFRHDGHMRNDRRVKVLRANFGMNGYAVWGMLLETLTTTDGFRIAWGSLEMELLAGDFGIPMDRFSEIVQCMVRLNMVQIEGDVLKCDELMTLLRPLIDDRQRTRDKRAGGFVGDKPDLPPTKEISSPQIPHSIVEDIIVEDSTEIDLKKEKNAQGANFENGISENADYDQGVESTEKELPLTGGAAASDQDTPEKTIRKWGAADNWKWVTQTREEAGYNPDTMGMSVNDRMSLFCGYHSENPDFKRDPVDFFKKKFKGWLINAKTATPASKGKGRPRPSALVPVNWICTPETVTAAFQSRYGANMTEHLTQQNIDRLVQAKNEAELSSWMDGFYNQYKNKSSAHRGGENLLSSVAATLVANKPGHV